MDAAFENEKEERLTAFIESRKVRQTPFLMQLYAKAREDGVPVIRPQTQALIAFLLGTVRPARILEIGTAVGYSALFMQEYAPRAAITTIEKDAARAGQARQNFAAAGVTGITLLEGDAGDVLATLREPFDFLFLDAAKGQYVTYLPDLKRLMHTGSVLLTDNILKDGEILESKFAVTRRNRTIHKRMHAYLDAVTEDPELTTVLLSTGDGAAMSVRL